MKHNTLEEFKKEYLSRFEVLENIFKDNLNILNRDIYRYLELSESEQEDIHQITLKSGVSNEGYIFSVQKEDLYNRIFSILLGCSYGRWDMRIFKHWNREWSDEEIFKARKHSPFLYGSKESTLDLVLPEYHDEIRKIWNMPYPIEVLSSCFSFRYQFNCR